MRIPSEARISRRVFCQGPHFGLASSRHQQGSRGNSKAITSAKPSQAALRKNASVIVISDSDSDDHVSEVDTGPGGGKSTDKVRAQGKGKQKESNSSETVSECRFFRLTRARTAHTNHDLFLHRLQRHLERTLLSG